MTTPTAALVEEAEKLSTQATPGPWCHNRYGVNNWPGPDAPTRLMELLHNDDKDDEQNVRDAEFIARARTMVPELAAALRRAETERDAALKQSAAWEIQAQDMRDRLIKAEAERDAQHEQVLRLTAERDALAKDLARIRAVAAIAGSVARWDSLLNEMHQQKAKVSDLTATRDPLTAENARLRKERDAALALEADTARRSSAEIDSLKAECNEARSETEDLNRRVAELHAQRDEARAHIATLELLRRGGK